MGGFHSNLGLGRGGDPVLAGIRAAEQRRRNVERLEASNAAAAAADAIANAQSRQVRRALERKAGKGRG